MILLGSVDPARLRGAGALQLALALRGPFGYRRGIMGIANAQNLVRSDAGVAAPVRRAGEPAARRSIRQTFGQRLAENALVSSPRAERDQKCWSKCRASMSTRASATSRRWCSRKSKISRKAAGSDAHRRLAALKTSAKEQIDTRCSRAHRSHRPGTRVPGRYRRPETATRPCAPTRGSCRRAGPRYCPPRSDAPI